MCVLQVGRTLGMEWDNAVLTEKYMYDTWHRTYPTANTIQETVFKKFTD
jgi:hypothetical protein